MEMTTEDFKDKIIHLNVGGTQYAVSRDTLERCKGSMLASLVSDKWEEGNSTTETIFIDRNGRLFEYVLDSLRSNQIYLPCSVSQKAVKEELEYYGIYAKINMESEMYSLKQLVQLSKEVKSRMKVIDAIKTSFRVANQFAEKAEEEKYRILVDLKLVVDRELLSKCLRARGLQMKNVRRDFTSILVSPIED